MKISFWKEGNPFEVDEGENTILINLGFQWNDAGYWDLMDDVDRYSIPFHDVLDICERTGASIVIKMGYEPN